MIFALSPGYLSIDCISTNPSSISGTSFSNNLYKKCLSLLDTIISGPFDLTSTDFTTDLIVSPLRKYSDGICSWNDTDNFFENVSFKISSPQNQFQSQNQNQNE